MAKYIKLFDEHSQYEEYISGQTRVLPNVSFCKNVPKEVHYNQIRKLVGVFNVAGAGSMVQVMSSSGVSLFSKVTIDGTVQPSVVSAYTFSTAGEHTVKYYVKDMAEIGVSALSLCTQLIRSTVPNGITKLNTDLYKGCSNLVSVKFPDTLKHIANGVFYNCNKLTGVTIPDSVEYVGNSCFNTCSQLVNLKLSNNLTAITPNMCNKCTSLTAVTIPDKVAVIDNSAFDNCRGLLSVNFGNGLTTIGNRTFISCLGLRSIELPSGLTSIGQYAFAGCNSLSSVTIHAVTPPSMIAGAFNDNASGRKIYVPAESVNAYKAATNWSAYAGAIEAIPS